jgi:hypothetical protein
VNYYNEFDPKAARHIPAESESVFQWVVDGLPGGMDAIGAASLGFPLAGKIPGRAALLKGYGNSIVPQVAAQFVRAYLATAHA